MSTDPARLAALRAELAAQGLDGFMVPISDAHLSEYVGAADQRLRWLSGFDGSAGTAVVTADEAVLFVDGRYTLAARGQVSAAWTIETVPATSPAAWIAAHAGKDARIGYDPWLHSGGWAAGAAATLAAAGAALVPVTRNPVDAVWRDRPQPSAAPIEVHDDALAGRSAADKRAGIAAELAKAGADATVVAALDGIAWAFNIRGRDVPHTPVARGFAIIHGDASAELFVDPAKLDEAVRAHLGAGVRLRTIDEFAAALGGFGGRRVAFDRDGGSAAIAAALEAGGATIVARRDLTLLPKATKTAAEIAGSRAAHLRDGAALTRFLHWLSIAAPAGGVDERGAAARLLAFRQATGALVDLSFDTISAAGPNAASPHYRVTEASNRPLETGTLYLVDSGGQYRDGTTDITRTIAVGTPTAEMCDRFTRVLKGHIALATARFPAGTSGGQLDTLARQHLWAAGLDYAHGTGHGVGAFLSVHEGPQRIAPLGSGFGGGSEPLLAGMILSNEPGYYKAGAWGIRIENLVLVTEVAVAGGEQPTLAFETLSFAPIDRALIESELMDVAERAWLDGYHADVLTRIGPLVDGEARDWLEAACRPL